MKCLVLRASNMSIFSQESSVNITPLAESHLVFFLIEEKKREPCLNHVKPPHRAPTQSVYVTDLRPSLLFTCF